MRTGAFQRGTLGGGYKRRILSVLMVIVMAACMLPLSGCYTGVITEREPRNDALPDIVPPEMEDTRGSIPVALMFRYLDEMMLTPQTVSIQERSDRTPEESAVRALLDGPPASRTDLSPLFAPGVELLEARLSGKDLILTFNATLTDPPSDMNLPLDWEADPVWEERVSSRRRLATYAIVNTVTQMGRVRRVLFYVDEQGDGTNERVRRRHLGFAGDSPSEAVGRDSSYILTPQSAVIEALRCLVEQDFTRLERYVALKGLDGRARPTREVMADELSRGLQVIDYDISDCQTFISADGASVVIGVDLFTTSEGKRMEEMDIPVRVLCEKEVWRVPYEELEALLLR